MTIFQDCTTGRVMHFENCILAGKLSFATKVVLYMLGKKPKSMVKLLLDITPQITKTYSLNLNGQRHTICHFDIQNLSIKWFQNYYFQNLRSSCIRFTSNPTQLFWLILSWLCLIQLCCLGLFYHKLRLLLQLLKM